jgi:hypothetical protein
MTCGASGSSAGTQPLGVVPMPKARRGTHRPAPPTERRMMSITISQLRALLSERLSQRSHWRELLAQGYMDDGGVNLAASDLLAAWSKALSEMPDDAAELADLAELVLATGKDTPQAALDDLHLEVYRAASRVGMKRGPATLQALLREWSDMAAAGSLQHEGA